MPVSSCQRVFYRHHFSVRDYDLSATLNSGQTFRWTLVGEGWEGVVDGRFVRLSGDLSGITAETVEPVGPWDWLADYLQVQVDYAAVVAALPRDAVFQAARAYCHGLRLLRQAPWECLASFILSSTKQIGQISRVIEALCEQYGEPVRMPPGRKQRHSFPTADRLAPCSERELRGCGMGFRAPYLQAAARAVSAGQLDLESIRRLDLPSARRVLTGLKGVGPKIADCVLLFAYGFDGAFPVDVWVHKALQRYFFADRPMTPRQRLHFSQTHFGPMAGYAQQYLFHYIRRPIK